MSKEMNLRDAVVQTNKNAGPPPVIGTFTPHFGDIGRDSDAPFAILRIWDGEKWYTNKEPMLYVEERQ